MSRRQQLLSMPLSAEDTPPNLAHVHYRRFFETARDGMLIMDADTGKITDVNPYLLKLLGFSRADFVNKHFWDIRPFMGIATNKQAFEEWRRQEYQLHDELSLETNEGERIGVEWISTAYSANQVHWVQCMICDLPRRTQLSTDLRTQYEESNEFLANYDALTNLPNRNLLNNRLEKAIRLARRESKHLAILFLDLDNFKIINDSWGHDAGDKVLAGIARQLNGFVRAGDTVSRWGGDEFVILLWDCGIDGAAFVADKLTGSEFKADGIDMNVSMSAGISIFPEDGEHCQVLLKNADIAMYHAKRAGRQNYEFFTPAMNAQVRERFLLESEMRHALDQNEFALFYQPRINMCTGKISGVEALLRWLHPTRGMLLPAAFLPVAEESGLIRRISEWVLINACRQIRLWQNQISELPIAVNIAPAYFKVQEFEEIIRTTLSETRLSPACLELELTENTLITNPEKTFTRLVNIKALGVQLSIDNFGTGYSSLLFLKKISVDKLKIDGSFVKALDQTSDGIDLVRSIISMGHNLKASVVAGNVENDFQLSRLRSEGCDEGQGFYFCRPVSAEKLTALIAGNFSFMDLKNVSVSYPPVKRTTIHSGRASGTIKMSRSESPFF